MSVLAWCSRRAGGLVMIALLALCSWVISQEFKAQRNRHKHEQPEIKDSYPSSTSTTGAGICTIIFAYYCLLLHILVTAFPVRACWSVWNLTQVLKRSLHNSALVDLKRSPGRRRGSFHSVSSSETLISSQGDFSSTLTESGDVDPETYTDGSQSAANVVHAIIIPNYKEELDTLRETLDVLASHPYARESYDICLGMEQREAGAEIKALGLIQEFAKSFRAIDFTLHPGDVVGEAAGKGSNVAWAARKLSAKYSMGVRKDVIVTEIDADSHLSSDYFALLTNMHLSYPETASTTLYSVPIIFDRNANKVPAIVRVADIMWCAGGLSGLYRGSVIAPPTSVYSLPLELVDRVGGWDSNNEAIGEDLHMYIKCFFAMNGNLTCRVINSPVSQTNVSGGCGGGYRGVSADVKARYKQAIRHMWGALDSGYALRQLVQLWQERKHTSRAYQPLHSAYSKGSDWHIPDSQLSDSESEETDQNGIFSDITKVTIPEPHWENIFYLSHRLFEAHFLPLHMTILVVASTMYVKVAEGNGDPSNLAWIFNVCNIFRITGFLQVSCYLFLYESFHRVAVALREREMVRAGLAQEMHFSRRSLRRNLIDYLMIPLVAPLYGAIPCAQAQICHFWTLDLVYTVSKKVTRKQAQPTNPEYMA